MTLRFTILEDFGGKKEGEKVVLEKSLEEFKHRLQARVAENLSTGTKLSRKPKFKHSREEIHAAIDKAIEGFKDEFKGETIKLV